VPAVRQVIHATCGRRQTTLQMVHMLRGHRKKAPQSFELKNGLSVPLVGFGTGATARPDVEVRTYTAWKKGGAAGVGAGRRSDYWFISRLHHMRPGAPH
jgi:hypothetical protein